jgi:hypothetical protein
MQQLLVALRKHCLEQLCSHSSMRCIQHDAALRTVRGPLAVCSSHVLALWSFKLEVVVGTWVLHDGDMCTVTGCTSRVAGLHACLSFFLEGTAELFGCVVDVSRLARLAAERPCINVLRVCRCTVPHLMM